MSDDNEGFKYPVINKESCINCCLCEKVCPVINNQNNRDIINAYGIKNSSQDIMMRSSSGGFFSIIAEYIISKKGVVFGACFDDNWNVIIDYTENINEIARFRGSKYVQAKVNNAYIKVKEFLKDNRLVLYTGTPCQIKALKHFLHKDYENLLCIDFICHGVPSPGVWTKYIHELGLDNIKSIDFRNKEHSSWEKFNFKINNEDSENILEYHYVNPYMKGFLSNITIRPSCSACHAKGGKSNSDITMADFWGVKEIDKNFYDSNGVSLVFSFTSKGNDIVKELNCHKIVIDKKNVSLTNISFMTSSPLNKKRSEFFKRWRMEPVIPLLKLYSKEPLFNKVKYFIRLTLVKLRLNHKINILLNRIK